MEELLRWGWLAAIVANLLVAWIGWSLRKQFLSRGEADERFKAQDERWGKALTAVNTGERDVSNRLTRVEERLTAVPSHADLTRIHDRLDRIADVTGRLEGSLKPLDRLIVLLTQSQLDRERSQ